MAFDALPNTIIDVIFNNLELLDAISLACACKRLHRQASETTRHSRTFEEQQQPRIPLLAAAARQRLSVAAEGAWRDELLLTAWQQQQSALPSLPINAVSALRTTVLSAKQVSGAGTSSNLSADDTADPLHCGLGHGFISAAHDRGRHQQLVEYSSLFVPPPAAVAATSCVITDLHASALVTGSSSMSSSSSSSITSSKRTSATAGTSGDDSRQPNIERQTSQQQKSNSSHRRSNAQQQPQHRQHAAEATNMNTAAVNDSALYHHLQLLKGHMPPQIASQGLGAPTMHNAQNALPQQQQQQQQRYQQQHQQQQRNCPRSTGSNPVADVLANSLLAANNGLQQVLWLFQQLMVQHAQQWLDRLKASVGQASSSNAQESRDLSDGQCQQPQKSGLKQVLVLSNAAPAGSVAGLNHPWPPQMHSGANTAAAAAGGGDGCYPGLQTDHVLRQALLQQQPAVLLRRPESSTEAQRDLMAAVMNNLLPDLRLSLQHLELSGITSADAQLATVLQSNEWQQLRTLSLAGTAAGQFVFKSLAGDSTAADGIPPAAAAAVNRSSGPPKTLAERVLQRSRGMLPPKHNKPPPPAAAAARFSQLVVLDVSGCQELRVSGEACVAFRRALSTMTQLRVLLACGINVDAVLQPCLPPPPAAAATVTTVTAAASALSHPIEPPEATASALQATLSGLAVVDVSCAVCLSVDAMMMLITKCGGLKKLGVMGCKTLAEHGGTEKLQAALMRVGQQQQQQQTSDSCQPAITTAVHDHTDSQQTIAAAAAAAGGNHNHAGLESHLATLTISDPQHTRQPRDTHPQQQATAETLPASDTNDHQHWPTNAAVGNAQLTAAAAAVRLPQLTNLCVGWGWSAASVTLMLQQSQHLTSFTAGVGGCVTDSVLQSLAVNCKHLQQLKLSLCPVSSVGLSSVIAQCHKLTTLQLQQCVGPFNMTDILQQHTADSSSRHPEYHQQQQQQHRWQLSTLQLDGSVIKATDKQILRLLAVKRPQQQQQQQQHTDVSSKHHQRHTHKPDWSLLLNLCLVGVRGLTDQLLYSLADAGCELKHLRLEECYRTVTNTHNTSSSSSSTLSCNCASSSSKWLTTPVTYSFSKGALLHLLQHSCRLSLRSLQLRHAVSPLTADFVSVVSDIAPLLQRLVLDGCDLPKGGGFQFTPGAHAALQAVHVIKCQQVDEAVAAVAAGDLTADKEKKPNRHHHHKHDGQPAISDKERSCAEGHVAGAGDSQQQSRLTELGCGGSSTNQDQLLGSSRKCDKQLIVHLFPVGRSLHLTP